VLADLQVTLGAGHRIVTQQSLNGSQVHPGFQEMGSKTVAQGIIILLTNSLSRRSITDIIPFMEPKSK
jgi:ethanolamine transporter EutH